MCKVSRWQWCYSDDFGLQEGSRISCETHWCIARAVPSFPASWTHEGILDPKASFYFSTSISYILHSFLQSPPHYIYFQAQGMPWMEKLCFLFLQSSLSLPLLKASDWAGWNCTKAATQTQRLGQLVTILLYWVTSLGSQISALCSLHAENASLERRGHWGLMFKECRTSINACGN